MSKMFSPMLAAEAKLELLRFPLYASPKLDGVRALVFPGRLFSRSMKLIPNEKIQEAISIKNDPLNGFDGELIAGEPNAKDVYNRTVRAAMKASSEDPLRLFVFDTFGPGRDEYDRRISRVRKAVESVDQPTFVFVEHRYCVDLDALLAVEEKIVVDQGYEGLILRSPTGLYKNGRSTVKEQGMLKLKRFTDAEAEIIGIEEEMHNGNEAKTNAVGHTERSSHAANLKGKGRMGALVVRDLKTKVEFKLGTGFSAKDRDWFWAEDRTGLIVKYQHFLPGAKDKPRIASYLGLRAGFDL